MTEDGKVNQPLDRLMKHYKRGLHIRARAPFVKCTVEKLL